MSSYVSVQTGHISEILAGQALDAAVRALFGLSWGRARDLIKRGKICVDGQVARDSRERVTLGSAIEFDPAARKVLPAMLADEALVYVDAHLVVVDKPAGIATIPYDPDGMAASLGSRASRASRETGDVTLDACVRASLARRERIDGVAPGVGVVHRLDKETSGLLVFARSWPAKKALTQAFRVRAVQRLYLAIVHGRAESETLRSHFVDDRGDGLRGSIERRRGRKTPIGSESNQLATTHVTVTERLPGKAWEGEATVVECQLETGRTHQIRIHLSERGHPLVGERVYIRDWSGPLVAAPRLMLHAAELGFVHPVTQREMHFASRPPADFEAVVARLR